MVTDPSPQSDSTPAIQISKQKGKRKEKGKKEKKRERGTANRNATCENPIFDPLLRSSGRVPVIASKSESVSIYWAVAFQYFLSSPSRLLFTTVKDYVSTHSTTPSEPTRFPYQWSLFFLSCFVFPSPFFFSSFTAGEKNRDLVRPKPF